MTRTDRRHRRHRARQAGRRGPARTAAGCPGRGPPVRAAARARDDPARRTRSANCAAAGSRWRSSSTSTAAPPASSRSRTSSRRLVGEVVDEHDRTRAGHRSPRELVSFPGILRPDELRRAHRHPRSRGRRLRDRRGIRDVRARQASRRRRRGADRGGRRSIVQRTRRSSHRPTEVRTHAGTPASELEEAER